MKKILRKKPRSVEVSMSETISDPSLDGDVLSFSEHLNSIISSKPTRPSRVSGSTSESSKPKKTLSAKPERKRTSVEIKPVLEPLVKKSPAKKVPPQKPNVQEDLSDYIQINKADFNKLDLYDQIRYINKSGKLVSGGFIVKKEFDISKKQTVWYLSADRRQTGFSWRIYPDSINQLWKKKIYIPELSRLDYVIDFLSNRYGPQFTNNLPA